MEKKYFQKQKTKMNNNDLPTMAISNCLFSPTSENPCGFSVWCVLAKLSANSRNYSQPKPLALIKKNA